MSRATALLLVIGLLLIGSRPATGQFVTLSVTASPGSMTINSAVAGSQPVSKSDNSTSYKLTSILAPAQKITAHLNAAMPVGTTLTGNFAAVGGGASTGAVVLDLTPRNMVNNIGFTFGSSGTITYVFSATVAAGVVPLQSRTVTITVSNYP
ncbi:MAG: hypothetical protein ABJE10_17695 [bacterium]